METNFRERLFGMSYPFRPFNVYGCLEAGVRFPVYRAFGIYFGGYADLGFLRMVKYTVNQFLTYSTGINPSGSIFAAAEDKLNLTKNEKDYLVVSFSKEPMYKGILPFSAGIKIKFAF